MADEDVEELVRKKLSKYGNQIVTAIREKLLERGHLATGKLYESVQYKVETEGDEVVLSIQAEDYFVYVDHGRGPGKQPPLSNILNWVQVRGIRPKSSFGIPGRGSGVPRTDRSLAFLIARKIGLEGIKAAKILDSTLEEVQNPIPEDLNDLIVEAIQDILRNGLNDISHAVNSNIIQTITK